MNLICDQMGEASPEELEKMMDELGTDVYKRQRFYRAAKGKPGRILFPDIP